MENLTLTRRRFIIQCRQKQTSFGPFCTSWIKTLYKEESVPVSMCPVWHDTLTEHIIPARRDLTARRYKDVDGRCFEGASPVSLQTLCSASNHEPKEVPPDEVLHILLHLYHLLTAQPPEESQSVWSWLTWLQFIPNSSLTITFADWLEKFSLHLFTCVVCTLMTFTLRCSAPTCRVQFL